MPTEEQKIVALALARFGFPQWEIARETGLPQPAVSVLARAAGIRRRKHAHRPRRVPAKDRRAIAARVRAGETPADVAKHTGLSISTICRICRRK